MKGGAHDIMIVSRQDRETSATGIVPETERLIVRRGEQPGKLSGMELYSANVIQMAEQRKEAAAQLVVPDLDLVVVSAGHQQWFGTVEVDAADGAVVLLKAVYDRSDAVVPTVSYLEEERPVNGELYCERKVQSYRYPIRRNELQQ